MNLASQSSLVEAFVASDRLAKAGLLARLAHHETIHIRSYLHDDPKNCEAVRRSNEFIHRLCGHITRIASAEPDPDQDRSFMNMVLDVLEQRGHLETTRLSEWMKI
jgi:hypothetical protein